MVQLVETKGKKRDSQIFINPQLMGTLAKKHLPGDFSKSKVQGQDLLCKATCKGFGYEHEIYLDCN